MRRFSNQSLLIASSLLAALAIITCFQYVDSKVALAIWSFTSAQPLLHKHFETIPNTLPKVVAIITTIMWLAYYRSIRSRTAHEQARFLRLAACAVPIAYAVKVCLQWAFGRTNIRLWLRVGGEVEFNWFNPLENWGGFPSGHMVVLTAFFSAIWLYYPSYRPLVVAATLTLAMMLLLTSYHFVSDILAGICCGILVTVAMDRLLSKPV